MRLYASESTWIDSEDLAYPAGSLRQSRRRAKVVCPDNRLRIVKVGIPDTFFSIPATCSYKGTRVSGYVTNDNNVLKFYPYKYGKNAALIPMVEIET